MSDRPLAITDPELAARTGPLRFFSATHRLFAIDGLEDACEDHGQAVIYDGGIAAHPHVFPTAGSRIRREGRFPIAGLLSGRAGWDHLEPP